jgi:hypothetical protein
MNKSKNGYGITFIDLDETLFRTFAKINVLKEGKVIRKLSNQDFNAYKLGEGESFEFSEFEDAKLFNETSIPIEKTISRIKRMIQRIKETKSFSRIIVLTARPDFLDKETFLQSFKNQGIDVNDKNVFYIERAGNIKIGTIAEKKRNIVLKYLKTGIYRKCRMIDDDLANLKSFLDLEKNLPEEIIEKTRKEYALRIEEKPITFYALRVDEKGNLERL